MIGATQRIEQAKRFIYEYLARSDPRDYMAIAGDYIVEMTKGRRPSREELFAERIIFEAAMEAMLRERRIYTEGESRVFLFRSAYSRKPEFTSG